MNPSYCGVINAGKGVRWATGLGQGRLPQCVLVILSAAAFWICSIRPAAGQEDFDYSIVSRTGQEGLTGIKSAPSVNRQGQVAFVANLAAGESLFFSNGGKGDRLVHVTPSLVGTTFSTFLQLSDDGAIVARDGSGTNVKIRLWYPNDPDSNDPIADPGSGPGRVCTGGRRGGQPCGTGFDCLNWDNITFSGCIGVNRSFLTVIFPAMNNYRQTVFQGVLPGFISPTNILVSSGAWGTSSNRLDTRTDAIRPVIADNGLVVGRVGVPPGSPLRLFSVGIEQPLTFVRDVAGASNGFTEIGQAPGISDDGGTIAFYGNANGPGIFAYFTESNRLMRVARLQTNSVLDASPITAFVPENRVAVNKAGSIAFLAINDSAQKAIFLAHSKITTNSEPLIEQVIAVGGSITNLAGTVSDLAITDGLNDQGDIAFLATMTDGTKAIVKAKAKECTACKCRVGQCELAVNSIDLKIGLGNVVGSSRTAYLKIAASTPSATLSTPAALVLSSGSGLARVMSGGSLRQVRSATALANITIENEHRYYVRFYTAFTGPDATGLFVPSGAPFSTVMIENPDGGAASNRLRVVQNGEELGTYTYIAASDVWELAAGFANGTRKESVAHSIAGNSRVSTRLVKDDEDRVLSRTVNTYQNYPWGEELVETREGLEEDIRITTYVYYTAVTDGANYGHLRKVTFPDGRWEYYKEYHPTQGLVKSVSQFLNNPYIETAAWPDPENRSAEVLLTGPVEMRTEYLKGHATSRRWQVQQRIGESWSVVATDPRTENYDAPSNLVTRTFDYLTSNEHGARAGQASRIVNPDGTLTLFAYYTEMTADPGNPEAPKIEANRTVTWSGASNLESTQVVDGTIREEVTDLVGNALLRREWDAATGLLTGSELVTARDVFGRATRTEYLDGTSTQRSYGCCGLESETDREGNLTTYSTDKVVRLDLDGNGALETYYGTSITRLGIGTHTLTDGLGRTLKTILQGTNGALIVQDERHYNSSGELDWSRDAMGRQTTYRQTIENGFRVQTTGLPDGSQSVQISYQDGSAYETRGNAVQGLRYGYDLVQDTGIWVQRNSQTRLEADGSVSPEYTASYTDFAGRAYKTEYPWPDGQGLAFATSEYNSKGQLVKSVDADGITTLYSYNARGELETTAMDVENPGIIDFGGKDRITRTRTGVSKTSAWGVPVRSSTTEAWEVDGSSQPTLLQTTETSLDGARTWSTRYGLTTLTVTALDRGGRRRTVTTTNPDKTFSVTVVEQGHQTSVTRYDANSVQLRSSTFAYNSFGRLSSETDARNGATRYTYFNDGQIRTVTTPDPDLARSGPGYDPQTTGYAYFRDPVNGIKTITTLPDQGVVVQEFFPSGQLKRTWGARTSPAEYTYDRAGRIKTLKTWQHFDFSTGQGMAGDALTTWNYNARGSLVQKLYADNKGPSYTYSLAGRLLQRRWARGVVTTYGYDPKTGELLTILYSDSTPAVTNAYARSGRVQSVTDASGIRHFGYQHGQRTTESYISGMFAGISLQRGLDPLYRLQSLTVTTPLNSLYQVGYSYDAASRLRTVTAGPDVASYTYEAGADLVNMLTLTHSNQVRLTTMKIYDSLNRLRRIANIPSADVPTRFDYDYGGANQRMRATLANGEYWSYTYDALGQVTGGSKRFSDNTPIPGYLFGYGFDDLGNRLSVSREDKVDTYTNNVLNQMIAVQHSPWLHVLGSVSNAASLTINGQPPVRSNGYFYAQLAVTSRWNTVAIQGRVVGQGENGKDAFGESIGQLFQPSNPEPFRYDEDGNMLSDGRWLMSWDGENRLRSVESVAANAREDRPGRVDYGYDSQNRLIRRLSYLHSSTQSGLIDDTRWIYDGWRQMISLSGVGSQAIVQFTWGLDISGSAEGAGGIGGLLRMHDAAMSEGHFYAYDGNGNVVGMHRSTDSIQTATYEYDPFGKVLRISGAAAQRNPFRFSTKLQDEMTDLCYYGYRFYSPSTGRWPERDPIEEAGGLNIYGMVDNNPVNHVDTDGRRMFPGYQPPPPRPPPNKPNEESYYNVHYSKNSITLNFHACRNCNELRDRLYADLKTFKNWGNNSVASINVSGDIANFYPGLLKAAGGMLVLNDPSWRVRLSNDDSTHCVSARTLDDHPLVGVRKWCASVSKQLTTCTVTITTEAYERPRNLANYWGGRWFGRDDQRQIWEDYFGNIAGAYKDDSCFQSSQRGTPVQRDTGSTTNPWIR